MINTRKQYFEFSKECFKSSKLLFNSRRYHLSICVGGYVIEAYLKALLYKEDPENINTHNLKTLLRLCETEINNIGNRKFIDLLKTSTIIKDWHPVNRYNVLYYQNEAKAKLYFEEIENIQNEIDDLNITI